MIPQEQLDLIEKYLVESENPLFFYHDDPDGVSSYLLLKKYIDRGYGVILKTTPNLSEEYVRKVQEYTPDKVFVLDMPIIDQEFIDKVNVPIIWIDHHPPIKRQGAKYFNPRLKNPRDSRSASYWCYKITNQNKWIAALGIIGDWQVPDFLKELKKEYPDLITEKTQPKLLFKTKFGRLCKIVTFLLKGRISTVKKNINALLKINSPYDLLEGKTTDGKYLLKQITKIEKEYNELLEQAVNLKTEDDFLIFVYPSKKTSFTGELSNELLFKFPKKYVIVGREKDDRIKMGLRSSKKPIQKALEKALVGIDGYGGGHEKACGANVAKEDFNQFIENFKRFIS